MAKRFVVAGLLVGTILFALSGCETQNQIQDSEGVVETQVSQEAHEVSKAEEVEAVTVAEKVKEVQKVENTKLTLRINCGAAEPYIDKAGNTWLADQGAEPGGYQKPAVRKIENVTVTNGQLDIGFTLNIQNSEINGIEILSE